MYSPRAVRGRRLIAEAIGTFFLVLIGPGTVMADAFSGGAVGHVGVALAFALVVIAMVYALGHLSGAHINPAVTIAFRSAGRFPTSEVVPYIGAQCTGAAVASLALRAVMGPAGNAGATLPAVPLAAAFGVEWLLSFALMFVIMAVATDARVADGFAPIAVGLTVGFCALMGGPLTGASMNPARSLGPALVGGHWYGHWVYWVAPITGMIAAVRAYEFLRPAHAPPASPLPMLGAQGPVPSEPGTAAEAPTSAPPAARPPARPPTRR
jgi:aquaporin Z